MQELYLKTKIIFGENGLENLTKELKNRSINKLLLVFAGGGLLKTKIFHDIQDKLKENKIKFILYTGINPNPLDSEINEALDISKDFEPEMVLSVGGGSNHDASKVIAMCLGNSWNNCSDYVLGKVIPKEKPLSLGTIATAIGTGSDNNNISVVTLENDHLKIPISHPDSFPDFTIYDPKFTYSVGEWQTAAGGFDIFVHLLENFYAPKTFYFTQNIIISLMKTAIKSTRDSLKNPEDFSARANMMLSAAYGLNSLTEFQQQDASWNIHWLGHAISGYWNVTHGASLALVAPIYLEYACKNIEGFKERTELLGKEVFNVKGWQDTIDSIKKLIKEFKLPQKYTDLKNVEKILDEDILWLTNHFKKDKGKISGVWEKFSPEKAKIIFQNIKK